MPDWPPPPPPDGKDSSPEPSIMHLNFDSGTLKRMLSTMPGISPTADTPEPIYAYALPYVGDHVTERGRRESTTSSHDGRVICKRTGDSANHSPQLARPTSLPASAAPEAAARHDDVMELSSSPVIRTLPGDRLAALPTG